MTAPRKSTHPHRRPERLIDPYVVVPHTWTREEILACRHETSRRTATRRTRKAPAA